MASQPQAIHNETPRCLILKGRNSRILTLAPLERTAPLRSDKLESFDFATLQDRNFVRMVPVDQSPTSEKIIPVVIGAGFLYAFLGGWINENEPSWKVWYWGLAALVLVVVSVFLYFSYKNSRKRVLRWLTQAAALIVILTVAFFLPAAVIYWFGGGVELQQESYRLASPLLLLGRSLQWLLISVASVLPGLLYFLFDRQSLATMRDRFEQAIFRLDPNVATLTDVRAKYGRQM